MNLSDQQFIIALDHWNSARHIDLPSAYCSSSAVDDN